MLAQTPFIKVFEAYGKHTAFFSFNLFLEQDEEAEREGQASEAGEAFGDEDGGALGAGEAEEEEQEEEG